MKYVVKNVFRRVIRLGDWLSAGINSTLLDGCVDESISGRSYRMAVYEKDPKWIKVRKAVDIIWRVVFAEEEHCRGAYYKDLKRAQDYKARHDKYTKC